MQMESMERRQRVCEQWQSSQPGHDTQERTPESSSLGSQGGSQEQRFASLHWLQKVTSSGQQSSCRQTQSVKAARL